MQVRSYICSGPVCKGKEVPSLDHWRRGECPRPPMPVRWLLACVRHQQRDMAHRNNNLTATRLLTCPVQIAILDNLTIRLDPTRLNSGCGGHAIQQFADDYAEPGDYVRVRFPLPGQTAPRILNVEVSGEVDYMDPGVVIIEDMKFHSETAQMFKVQAALGMRPDPAQDADYAAQLSIYARIVRQCVPGADPKVLRIYDGAMVSGKGMIWSKVASTPWVDRTFTEMTDAQLAAHRPKGGQATVADLIQDYGRFLASDRSEQAIREMPLRGRTMMGGQMCPRYCLAREECDRLQGIVTS